MIKRYLIKSFITTTQIFLYLKPFYFTFYILIKDFDVVRDILIYRYRRYQILILYQKK